MCLPSRCLAILLKYHKWLSFTVDRWGDILLSLIFTDTKYKYPSGKFQCYFVCIIGRVALIRFVCSVSDQGNQSPLSGGSWTDFSWTKNMNTTLVTSLKTAWRGRLWNVRIWILCSPVKPSTLSLQILGRSHSFLTFIVSKSFPLKYDCPLVSILTCESELDVRVVQLVYRVIHDLIS
jgi:hypothetical protein